MKHTPSHLTLTTSGFILELGDFKTFGKADPFPRDETLRGNRAGGKVMMERFFFFTITTENN